MEKVSPWIEHQLTASPDAQTRRTMPPFVLKQDAVSGFIASLRRAGDDAGVEFIRPRFPLSAP